MAVASASAPPSLTTLVTRPQASAWSEEIGLSKAAISSARALICGVQSTRSLTDVPCLAKGGGAEFLLEAASADLIARTYSLGSRFDEAHALLDTLERAFADNQSSWDLDGEGTWH